MGLLEKFSGSQLENDLLIVGGAVNIPTHFQEDTYVGEGGDIRHTCDTTVSDEKYIGYTFPQRD